MRMTASMYLRFAGNDNSARVSRGAASEIRAAVLDPDSLGKPADLSL
jgi:hypothetical protein